jgi:acetyl esterase/lipase
MKQNRHIQFHTIKIRAYIIFIFVPLIFLSCSDNKTDGSPKPPNGYWNETTLKIAAFFGTLELIDYKNTPVPEDIVQYNDIVYRTVDSTKLKLDVFQGKNLSNSAPLLIFIHGGSWSGGDKKDYRLYMIPFARKGYVTATVQYRLSDKIAFPGQLLDINAAIRFLKKNAEKYHIDASKIALIGGSAGGHLALMSAYTTDITAYNETDDSGVTAEVQAIVDIYGPTDLTTEYSRNMPSVIKLMGKNYDEAPELYEVASPLIYVTEEAPPTLIFHGTIDDLVPISHSDELENKLKENGVPVYYHKLKGWPHAMDVAVEVNEYCQFYMNQFFEEYIPLDKK